MWAGWKLGKWPLLENLRPMAGKELILEKGSWELFHIQRLPVLHCCWWISLLSQCDKASLPAGISPCCCTRQPSIGYAMQWCTELFALDFNDLCRIKLWILSLLAHTEIHYLLCAKVSPVLFGFKSFALHNGCNALQSDCNAQSDNCMFFSTFQFIVCYRTTQPHSFQRYFSQCCNVVMSIAIIFTILYCFHQHCIAFHSIRLLLTALHCFSEHWIAFHSTALCFTVLHCFSLL